MSTPKPPSNSLKYVAIGLVCIQIILGATSAWLLYQNQGLAASLSAAEARYSILNASYEELQEDCDSLFSEMASLSSNYNRLQASYASIQARYASLEADYSSLGSRYAEAKAHLGELDAAVRDLARLLDGMALFPQAISRTLNGDQVSAVYWAVESLVSGVDDPWEAERRIYDFIDGDIRYEGDVIMPYIKDLETVTVDGRDYVGGFSTDYSMDYISQPSLTLANGYGDCDDQTILGYAMIKCFEREVVGEERPLYLALLTFEDMALHLCLIRPAEGGYAYVFDPSGDYISPGYGTANASKAFGELNAYSDYWAGHGGIREIALYEVLDLQGNYAMVANGTVADIASFLT